MSNLPLKTRLKRFQEEKGMKWEIIERDYLLSWILYAISKQPSLGLVFKGGTALKKCYFGDYRYSEDLDFTAIDLSKPSFEDSLREMVFFAEEQINRFEPCKLSFEQYLEKNPHPEEQEAYVIRGQFKWHPIPYVKAYIEITRSEELCCPINHRPLIHEYGELLDVEVKVYSLEEIIVEKLRAILQHTKKIHERAWTRSRARDYYDLWRIFSSYKKELQPYNYRELLEKKTASKNVTFKDVSSFFDDKTLQFVKQTWNQWLGLLVPNLPPAETILTELKPQISNIL